VRAFNLLSFASLINTSLQDKSKTILKDIYLSFYPGAKIGVIGLNGSGKSTLMKIMAGVDTEFEGPYLLLVIARSTSSRPALAVTLY
jgi:ATPase subunit of ABC transporter with duplicated ATPase domains